MKNIITTTLVCVFILIGFPQILSAQTQYKLSDSKNNVLELTNSPAPNDRGRKSQEFIGKAQFEFTSNDSAKLASLDSLTFAVNVSYSERDDMEMVQKASKVEKNAEKESISYVQTSSQPSEGKVGSYLIKSQGNLTFAGVTRNVSLELLCKANDDESIVICSGSQGIVMSDYKVESVSTSSDKEALKNDASLKYNLHYMLNRSAITPESKKSQN